jgi:membrane protease YdiL (CAAX protease family)
VPLAEEYTFRGALLPWATRRRYGPAVVLGVAVVFVANATLFADPVQIAPLVFVAILAVGLFGIFRVPKSWRSIPVRSAAAVYSTAALFAAVHSGVWPTPVPLFVLGLGLGYLVARTGRILPAVVVHGLFNAVSALLVLRGNTAG